MRQFAFLVAVMAATLAQARQLNPGDTFIRTNSAGNQWKGSVGADGRICGEGVNFNWKDCGAYQIVGATVCVQWEHSGNRCFNP